MNETSSDAEPTDLTTRHVAQARSGDPKSLEWLIRRFTPLLRSNADYRLGRRLRELYDPDDIVNDVWMGVLPSLPDLSPRDGRYTPVLLRYMSRTLLFRINNLIEKHIQGKPPKAKPAAAAQSDPVDALEAEATGVLTGVLRAEAKDLVHEAIERLEPKDRELILLRGVEQREYKEIAAIVQRDAKVLAVQYQRALKKLRKELPGEVFDELVDE